MRYQPMPFTPGRLWSQESGRAWGRQPVSGGVSASLRTNSACVNRNSGAAAPGSPSAAGDRSSKDNPRSRAPSAQSMADSVELPGGAGAVDRLDSIVHSELAVDALDVGRD